MAKWGEGDPIWIVEERPDATNVNNWHWTEKNAHQWSVNKFHELLSGLKIKNQFAVSRITEVDSCEGEAVANSRKGKLLFFFDWELKLKWKGHLNELEHSEFGGTVHVSNFNEEQEVSHINIELTVETSSTEAEKLKEVIGKDMIENIRKQLEKYIKALKEDFTQGMILPRKGEETVPGNGSKGNLPADAKSKVAVAGTQDRVKKSTNVKTSDLSISVEFQCTKEDFYNAFTTPELAAAFTHNAVKMDVRPGGAFELFGGNISGEFLELVPNTKICQKWRLKSWPEGHFSVVNIEIQESSSSTIIKLTQDGVPEYDLESTKENWNRYYWDAMKRSLGFGSFLL